MSASIESAADNQASTPTRLRVSPQKNIYQELITMGIDDDVATVAQKIFIENSEAASGIRKKAHVRFYCVYHAYMELGRIKVPKAVAAEVGLTATEINKALQLFPPRNIPNTTYLDFIAPHCKSIGIPEDAVNDIVNFFANIITPDNVDIHNRQPHIVAAGIISYYMTIHGNNFNADILSKSMNVSPGSIKLIHPNIAEIHNARS